MKKTDIVRALTDREKAREKLPVFYGSRDNFTHGFREVLNNGIDEILNNFDNGIVEVLLHDDLETISIIDSGRGIPVHEKDENGIPYYELIFTTLFASGKYDANDSTNSGTNGVGLSILNFSSVIFNVEVCTNGHKYIIEYENGGYIKTPLTKLEETNEHYTKITFKLDKEIYTSTKFSYSYIRDIIEKTSKVSPKITLKLKYKNNEETFHFESLEDYFNNHTDNNLIETVIGRNKLFEEDDGEKTQVQLVLSCSNNEDSLLQECMLNGNNLIDKNSIFDGVVDGVRNFVNKFVKDNNLYKPKEKPITISDVERAISFCCNVLSNRVEFQSQTKFSTAKKLYRKVVYSYIQEILEIYSIEYKEDFSKLVNQILVCKRAYETSSKLIESTKKKLSEKIDNINNKVEGLIDCKHHGENSELYITEGKSPLGSVIGARDPLTQAGYAIRGKILNCLKAKYETIFSNDVVVDLIKVFGCGVEVKSKHNKELDSFNINNLRYERIIISTDADKDGKSIQVLLLTMIYRLMPKLIEKGKVYIAQTPLFVITEADDTKHYAFDEKEKDTILKSLTQKYQISRLKGLGEMNSIDMYNTALNPETRQMIQVKIGDIEEMVRQFEVWMDEDVSMRKEFIQDHLHEYINDEE